jgi:hypothetical protein
MVDLYAMRLVTTRPRERPPGDRQVDLCLRCETRALLRLTRLTGCRVALCQACKDPQRAATRDRGGSSHDGSASSRVMWSRLFAPNPQGFQQGKAVGEYAWDQ